MSTTSLSDSSKPDLTEYANVTLPACLAPLLQSHTNLREITLFCEQSYAVEQPPILVDEKTYLQSLDQAQTYAIQGLSSLAYQINEAAKTLKDFLEMQLNEVENEVNNCEAMAQVTLVVLYIFYS